MGRLAVLLLLAAVAAVAAVASALTGPQVAARLGLRGETPLAAYVRRATALRAIGDDADAIVRDAKALEAASEALAALAAQHVAETTVDVQGDGSMVAFSRVFATKTTEAAERTAQDSGLLYMDAVTGAWSLLQYNSTLLAAAAAPTVVETAARAASLSVCSFNIRYGTASDGANHWTLRRDMVFDLLNRYSYDLIGVQEALNFQIDEILTNVPGYSYIGVGRDDGVEAGEYSAIFYRTSRLRVAASGTFWFCDNPTEPGCTSYGNSIPRIATWGQFVDTANGDQDFLMYNCHLDHQSATSRQLSVAQMVEHILAQPLDNTTVIVTGDFNTGETSAPIRDLNAAGFVDTFRVLYPNATNVGTFNSWVGTDTGDKIDYVFVSDGVNGMSAVETVQAAIIKDNDNGRYPSDHFPVSATIVF